MGKKDIIFDEKMTTKQKAEHILEQVKETYTATLDKEDLFTPQHTKFLCNLLTKYGSYSFTYQCNLQYHKGIKKTDLLSCLFSDASCYSSCVVGEDDDNIKEFSDMFGYNDNIKELLRAYRGCKNAYNALNNMFTKQEQEILQQYFEDEGLL